MTTLRRWAKRASMLSAALVLGLMCFLGYLRLSGNYHVVVPGELFRAGQITPAQIASYHAQDGIRSILNLRGASPGKDWYDAEVDTSSKLGIQHADFSMSASIAIDGAEAQNLITLMRSMPKPILVHCRHGADRSGLAAALYRAAIEGVDLETAEGQLSLRFGHFAVPWLSAGYPMTKSFETYEAAQRLVNG